ncbi:NXPE family member 3-like [Ptychodera flava]|uniref:NXPE family member 3-like n=1 Tax=Ptychodera flava TaxID=63121 RepID=UPI00396A664E
MANMLPARVGFFNKKSATVIAFCLGMFFGAVVYTQIFETKTITLKENREGSFSEETKPTPVRRLNLSPNCKADIHPQEVSPVRFPYNEYTRFGLEWTGIVDELEWSSKSLHPIGNDDAQPFRIRAGSADLTSTEKTRVFLYEDKAKYKIGDFVHVVIEAHDKYGGKRSKGGDFFEPVMFNEKLQKSTAGRVVDYGNGTYSVYFYAAWQGAAFINITLAFTREAILFLDNEIRYKEPPGWKGTFVQGNTSESTECYVISDGSWEDMCEFINHNALGGTAFVCEKPQTLPCNTLDSILHSIDKVVSVTEEGIADIRPLFSKGHYRGLLEETPLKVQISGSKETPKLPRCGPDLKVPMTDGYWSDNLTFVPMVCRGRQWTQNKREACLKSKYIRLSGGSTMRHVSEAFSRLFDRSRHLDKTHKFVALRIGPYPQLVSSMQFESDYMDGITTDECKTGTVVFIVNFSFHFVTWSKRSYLYRIHSAKLAAVRLFQRCPDAMVLIRLSNPRENVNPPQCVHSGDWILYDMNRMIRRVFGGIGVRFIDVWDMVLSHPDPNNVHMGPHVIDQQVQMMLNYICPGMVDL